MILEATVAAILGGSVFGDHCSPISDTTILSSMASSCDHGRSCVTQPRMRSSGRLAIVVGYLPDAFGAVSPWILLGIGFILIALWSRYLAKPVE